VIKDTRSVRDARTIRDARDVGDARKVSEGEVARSDVAIRRARAGTPQERVSPGKRRSGGGRRGDASSRGKGSFGLSRRGGGRPIASILQSQPWGSLLPFLPGDDPGTLLGKLKRYSELLLEWNRNVSNLISRHDESRLVERHLRESLEHAQWLAGLGCERWLDFGSGAGLPAIPLSIAGVGARWTLVESRRTKTLFIRKAVEETQLSGIEVVLGRLENVVEDEQIEPGFDGFTSRATLTLGPTLLLAAKLVKRGGYAFLWKGSRRSDEMKIDAGWKEHWEILEERAIGTGMTSLVAFRKIG
jgi:16S rRNA (guanine527-N7)-methyltransferase